MFKRIFLISLFLISSVFATEKIEWNEYMDIFFEKDRIKKPIMLFVSATTCKWCIMQKKNMDENSEVVAKVETSFYPVYVLKDRELLKPWLETIVTPTIFFLDPKTSKPIPGIDPIYGAPDMPYLLDYLDKAEQRFHKVKDVPTWGK